MEYNTTREKLILPEYGRLIQQMARHAVELPEKAQRQAYASIIIRLMMNLTPKTEREANYEKKLWDHLAYMTNYELDIDWPYEIIRHDADEQPAALGYPSGNIKRRNYGHIIESWIEKVSQMPEGPERDTQVRLLATRMKRYSAEGRAESDSDEKIARDVEEMSDGQLKPDFSNRRLADFRTGKRNKK